MGPRFFVQLQKQIFIGFGGNFRYERVFEEEFGAKRSATQEGAFYGSDPERSAYRKGFGTSPRCNRASNSRHSLPLDTPKERSITILVRFLATHERARHH